LAAFLRNPNAGFAPGDAIVGRGAPWSTFAVLDAKVLQGFKVIPKQLLGKLPVSYFLGTLGAHFSPTMQHGPAPPPPARGRARPRRVHAVLSKQ
jgi:hypothetical protein